MRDEKLNINVTIPSNGLIDNTLNQNYIVAGFSYLPIRNVAIKGDVRVTHTGTQNSKLLDNPNALPYQVNYNLFNFGIALSF